MIILKVLSIREPFATLIKTGKKKIETRSYKTNYRGELYIHASGTIYKTISDELTSLTKDIQINPGYIICKCRLVDCVYMTDEYVNEIKNNYQEYICGEYSLGRYAWVLDDIVPLDIPIKAKGQLNIWNYYNENEVMNLMTEIEFKEIELSDCKRPSEVVKSKIGNCLEQVELERSCLKNNDWNIKTYLVKYGKSYHSFLIYEKNNKYYWFEHALLKYRGIHEYSSLDELLLDVKRKLAIKDECIYEYKKFSSVKELLDSFDLKI